MGGPGNARRVASFPRSAQHFRRSTGAVDMTGIRVGRGLGTITCMLAGLAASAGCTPSYSPDTYASGAVQQASKVEQGIVAGRRQVGVSAQGTAGGITGAAVGGIAGAQAPGGGVRTALTALGGTVVGGLVGSGIEQAVGDTVAYEYVVRKSDNELVSVTQKDRQPLELGQKVLVIGGTQARIVADYIVPAPPRAPVEPVASTPLTPPAAPVSTSGPARDLLPDPGPDPGPAVQPGT